MMLELVALEAAWLRDVATPATLGPFALEAVGPSNAAIAGGEFQLGSEDEAVAADELAASSMEIACSADETVEAARRNSTR